MTRDVGVTSLYALQQLTCGVNGAVVVNANNDVNAATILADKAWHTALLVASAVRARAWREHCGFSNCRDLLRYMRSRVRTRRCR